MSSQTHNYVAANQQAVGVLAVSPKLTTDIKMSRITRGYTAFSVKTLPPEYGLEKNLSHTVLTTQRDKKKRLRFGVSLF